MSRFQSSLTGQALSTLGKMITNNQVMKTKTRTRKKTSRSMKMTVILASMRTAIRMMKRIEMS
jgi:hypothetical protein